MTDQQHPMEPPAGTVHMLWSLPLSEEERIAAAYRAGADQQLEACCKWVEREIQHGREWGAELCSAMRPEPPSLAEQALAEIQLMEGAMYSADLGCDFTATRAALERLQHLEQESNDN